MRALRFHGNKDIRVDDIPVPELRPGWVMVKNAWAGICGSDLHEYLIGPFVASHKPHVLTGETMPSVAGHEFSGTVTELGEGVTDLDIGQKVAIFPVISDGTCHWCQHEVLGMCKSWGFLGYSGWGGGMAEYICVERKAIHKIPENVPLDVAALVEPLAVGWHGVKLAKMKADETALVIGAGKQDSSLNYSQSVPTRNSGPIGIAVILCLQAHGITKIAVSEPSPGRAAQAREAGVTEVLDPTKVNVIEKVEELFDGLGPHAVFECAGVQATLDTAIGAVRGKGTIISIAIFEDTMKVQPNLLNRKSTTFIGSNIYTREEFQEVIDAIASGTGLLILPQICYSPY